MRLAKKIKFIVISLLLTVSLISQEDTIPKIFCGQLGVLSDLQSRIGFQFGLNYTVKNQSLISLRYYQNAEFLVGYPFKEPKTNYIQYIQNISLLYGYQFGSTKFQFIPMAGLSIGQGSWRNDSITKKNSNWLFGSSSEYHYEQFRYLGLNLNLDLLWTPSKYIGFSLDLFANIHQHPDGGIILSIVLGRLRK